MQVMEMKRGAHRRSSLLVAGAIIGLAALGHLALRGRAPVSDEYFYYPQILEFASGSFALDPMITSLPGYYLVMSGFASLFGLESLDSLRGVTLLFALLLMVVFHRCSRRLDPALAPVRTLQLFLLPVLSPLLFILYTDPFSLLLLMFAFLECLRGRYHSCAIAATLSLVVRQTNIFWLAMLFAMTVVETHGAIRPETLLRHARRYWGFVLGFAGFALFVLLNHGVAMGDTKHHPAFSVHLGNLFFWLLMYWVLFLPSNLANLGRIVRLVRRRPWIVAGIVALFVAYMLSYRADHPYNDPVGEDWYLRNRILGLTVAPTLAKVATFVPVAWAALSLGVTRLQRRSLYLLYPFTALSLVFVWLIDPRYYVSSMALLILGKRSEGSWVEWVTVVWFLVITVYLYLGSISGEFFL